MLPSMTLVVSCVSEDNHRRAQRLGLLADRARELEQEQPET
jgi:hypothetical protein